MTMLSLAMLLSADAMPTRRCAPTRLEACRDTNQLAWSSAFKTAIRRFIGKREAAYLYRGDVADQQRDVLGGPPEVPTRIGDLYRFTACRAHSCDEKGAAVLDPAGKIVATAILYSPCAPPDTRDCARRYDLVVFMRERTRRAEVVGNLRAWAMAKIAESYTTPGQPKLRFGSVRVIDPTAE